VKCAGVVRVNHRLDGGDVRVAEKGREGGADNRFPRDRSILLRRIAAGAIAASGGHNDRRYPSPH
jgi:hypothetical protein